MCLLAVDKLLEFEVLLWVVVRVCCRPVSFWDCTFLGSMSRSKLVVLDNGDSQQTFFIP